LKGLARLGAEIDIEKGMVTASARRLQGSEVYLDFPSVGATENIMMAAVGTPGTTIVENAAKEPEIVDLASFLSGAGATIRGAGTDLIKIEGNRTLQGTRFSVIPDRIEAGTYMIAAAAMGTDVTIENVISRHLLPIIAKLQDVGLEVAAEEDSLVVRRSGPLRATDIKTLPYPGFPTDLQSLMMSLL
jgi:UDP-N-acetylglucosamine 1-carboxyvinyltransferase